MSKTSSLGGVYIWDRDTKTSYSIKHIKQTLLLQQLNGAIKNNLTILKNIIHNTWQQ